MIIVENPLKERSGSGIKADAISAKTIENAMERGKELPRILCDMVECKYHLGPDPSGHCGGDYGDIHIKRWIGKCMDATFGKRTIPYCGTGKGKDRD